jgi:ATP-dependent helicase HrpB
MSGRPPPAPLPIDEAAPALIAALRDRGAAVLIAPPGSGKTTRAPLALLDAGLPAAGRTLLLQPRRVAARLAAKRMADERGTPVGGLIGWRVRFEDKTSRATRIEVITEGLLTRRLADDPLLDGVGMVILDEFHERSLHTDVGLALLAALRRELRPDLLLVVMSATMAPEPVQRFLGDAAGPAPLVRAEGRSFPVAIRHLDRPLDGHLDAAVAQAVRAEHAGGAAGHTLVFLPGVAEIDRVAQLLADRPPEGAPAVLPLHGRLSGEAQDAALAPAGRPKVVLSTNIAETSVTLEGVGLVIDSGIERRPALDPATGLTRLETAQIARDSADQRAGRAGRTGPGRCLRLWTEAEHRLRPASAPPAILSEDLSGLSLLLLDMGEDPAAFPWFEAPGAAALAGARALLAALGAVDARGITPLGRALARLPVEPRLGAVVLAGEAQGCARAAAAAAALAGERDPWPDQVGRLDLLDRIGLLDQPARRSGASPAAHRECAAVRDQLWQAVGARADRPGPDLEDRVVRALLAGFPERLARRREGDRARLLLASGSGAVLDPPEQLPGAELLVAVGLQAGRRGVHSEHRVRLAAPVRPGLLPEHTAWATQWDEERGAAIVVEQRKIGALVLSERRAPERRPEPEAAAGLLRAAALRRPGFGLPAERLDPLWGRMRLLARVMPELGLPAAGPDARRELLELLCRGRRSLAELAAAPVEEELLAGLPWALRQRLDALAPQRLRVPSGAELPLDYGDGEEPPVLAARIQQLFGLADTPRIAEGRVLVRLHLLAPNHRPQQVTQDLAGFWQHIYPEVRKELRGRYPKHSWPEDPLRAAPQDRPARRPAG